VDYCELFRDGHADTLNALERGSMPVRKLSAEEMLGGKPLVMMASPWMLQGLKKLQQAGSQPSSSAVAQDPRDQVNRGF